MSSPNDPVLFPLLLVELIQSGDILIAEHAACFRYSDNSRDVTWDEVIDQCNLGVLHEVGAQIIFIANDTIIDSTEPIFCDCDILSFPSPINCLEDIEPVGIKVHLSWLQSENEDDSEQAYYTAEMRQNSVLLQ
jgi:hypothetical protein